MEPWKDMMEKVPGALLTVALDTAGGIMDSVRSAHRMLTSFAEVTRTLRAATTPAELPNVADHAVLDASVPSLVLEGTLLRLTGLRALHISAGHSHDLDFEGGHHPDPDPLVQTWRGHHRDAGAHARDAERKLRSAVSITHALEDALLRVRQRITARSPFSLAWTALTSEFLRLAHNAVVATVLALHALRRMRDAVAVEFHDACRVLNR